MVERSQNFKQLTREQGDIWTILVQTSEARESNKTVLVKLSEEEGIGVRAW